MSANKSSINIELNLKNLIYEIYEIKPIYKDGKLTIDIMIREKSKSEKKSAGKITMGKNSPSKNSY
jgi:hypothetical protein